MAVLDHLTERGDEKIVLRLRWYRRLHDPGYRDAIQRVKVNPGFRRMFILTVATSRIYHFKIVPYLQKLGFSGGKKFIQSKVMGMVDYRVGK